MLTHNIKTKVAYFPITPSKLIFPGPQNKIVMLAAR
jgi:hypothetical protein